jgi:hypothetical protein
MILELLHNKKHKCGRFVVENSFSIFKKTFWKPLGKINLNVTFVPGVFTCCCLLHNLLWNQVDFQIEMLMHILELECKRNLQQAQNANDPFVIHIIESRKRPRDTLQRALTNYLGLQHNCTSM